MKAYRSKDLKPSYFFMHTMIIQCVICTMRPILDYMLAYFCEFGPERGEAASQS
jgi:hypothetical protein